MTVLTSFRSTDCLLFQSTLLGACAMFAFGSSAARADELSIPSLMVQPSMNIVLSVDDMEKSKEFYGEVLAITPMEPLYLPGNVVMTRYQVGTTEVKLLSFDAAQKRETGPIEEAIGVRRLTFFLPDRAGLIERMREHGYDAPKFGPRPGRDGESTIVEDPDGNQLELVIVPDGSAADSLDNIELGLTVGNIEKSRAFYGGFLGLEELEPIKDFPASGRTAYGFRHGNTTIRLWSFGGDVPTHAGRLQAAHGIRYIQYIVTDLDAVNDYAKSSGETIAQPIFALGNLARIMFIADPDGIINEFVGRAKQ